MTPEMKRNYRGSAKSILKIVQTGKSIAGII
jgi:hypothetical protein